MAGKPKPKGFRDLNNDKDRPLFNAGIAEGEERMRLKALSFLEDLYMKPEVTRDSVEGKAILKVASELSEHLGKLEFGKND